MFSEHEYKTTVFNFNYYYTLPVIFKFTYQLESSTELSSIHLLLFFKKYFQLDSSILSSGN